MFDDLKDREMENKAVREVTVIIPTYNRPDILRETVHLVKTNLRFEGRIRFLIGDDGDDEFLHLSRSSNVEVLPGPRLGLGANLNMLLKAAKTDVVLQMDDDHWLVKPLDITNYYDDLMRPMSMNGWIRLFLGEREDYYNNQKAYYKFDASNVGPYWYLRPQKRELYLPSNRPHLKRRDFHDSYGFYQEDVTLGQTEEAFCHQFEDAFMTIPAKELERRFWVTIPFYGLDWDQWQHVGDSWQKEGL